MLVQYVVPVSGVEERLTVSANRCSNRSLPKSCGRVRRGAERDAAWGACGTGRRFWNRRLSSMTATLSEGDSADRRGGLGARKPRGGFHPKIRQTLN